MLFHASLRRSFPMSRTIFQGFLFSILWASASIAGKYGLLSAEPLVMFDIRFFIAGPILLVFVLFYQRERFPKGKEWLQLTIFGAFNTALYLGLFILALQQVMPGITTLAIALNPLFISVMSAVWMKRRIHSREWVSLFLGISGVVVAAYPLLEHSYATPVGLILIAMSMLCYSFGSVYYTSVSWTLSRTAINAWQVFISAFLLLPFALLFHRRENTFDLRFWLALSWLIFPVSILAMQLWLRILKADAVRASLWLYLCPVFGFLFSALLLDEPITLFTAAGTSLVMLALSIGQRKPG
jgi:probable blue pigment (indigoidine) exporter